MEPQENDKKTNVHGKHKIKVQAFYMFVFQKKTLKIMPRNKSNENVKKFLY